MIVNHYEDIPAVPVEIPGASNVTIREVLTQRENAPNFSLRVLDVGPGGHSPHHDHNYEHEVIVLAGQGEVIEGETVHPLVPGTVILILPGVKHQFRNTGTGMLRFICLIPNQDQG